MLRILVTDRRTVHLGRQSPRRPANHGLGAPTWTSTEVHALLPFQPKTLLIPAASMLLALSAAADVRRVPQDYATIAAAFAAAINGDEVVVAPGTYAGPFAFPAKNIRFRSADGPATTILQGSGPTSGPVLQMATGTTLASVVEGFTITGGTGGYGGGINIQSGGAASILNNRIIGNTATAEGAGIYSYANNVLRIEGNVIIGNTSSSGGRAGAITALNGASVVRNNVFALNSAGSGGAIYAVGGQQLTIANCTFYANASPSGPAIDGNGSVVLQNCIFAGHAANPVRITAPATANATYTLVQGGSGLPWLGTGCLDADPLFVNPSANDFRLQPLSPAINAGNPAVEFNDPDGSRNDMGYTGGPGATPTLVRWTRKANMPQPRRNVAGAASGDAIYIFGGWPANADVPTRTVQMYEPQSNMWTVLADLPGAALRSASACALDGSIYLLGGVTSSDQVYNVTDQLLRFDPRSGFWTTCTPIPQPRLHASLHELNGKLYVLGGRSLGWTYTSTCWIYDPSMEGQTGGPWSQGSGASLSSPLGDNSGIALKGDLFTFGSYEPSVPARFTTYSARADSWRQLPAIPTLSPYPLATRLGNHGYMLDQSNRQFWRFEHTAQLSAGRMLQLVAGPSIAFEQLESSPESQAGGALIGHRGRIYLIGGGAPNSAANACWMYQ